MTKREWAITAGTLVVACALGLWLFGGGPPRPSGYHTPAAVEILSGDRAPGRHGLPRSPEGTPSTASSRAGARRPSSPIRSVGGPGASSADPRSRKSAERGRRPRPAAAAAAASAPEDDAPRDLLDRTVETVILRPSAATVVYGTSEPPRLEAEVIASGDVLARLRGLEIALKEEAMPRMAYELRCTTPLGDAVFEGRMDPMALGLPTGRYRADYLQLELEGADPIAVAGDRIEAPRPLFVVTSPGPPLVFASAQITPERVGPGGSAQLTYELEGLSRREVGQIQVAYGPDTERMGTLVLKAVLPRGVVDLVFNNRGADEETWTVGSLVAVSNDGRRARWTGPPLTAVVEPDRPPDPVRITGARFVPDHARPGEEVELVVDVEGGLAPESPGKPGAITTIATLQMTDERVESVVLRWSGPPNPVKGRVQLDSSLTPGLIHLLSVSVSGFDGSRDRWDRAEQAELLDQAVLMVE